MAESLQVATRLGAGGRVVIPARIRRALGLLPGAELVLSLREGELRIRSRQAARRWAQEQVCKLIPPGVSLVEELIRERRREAELD